MYYFMQIIILRCKKNEFLLKFGIFELVFIFFVISNYVNNLPEY